MRRRPILVLASLGCVLLSGRTEAYVRTQTSTGIFVAWKNPCIEMRFMLGAPPPLLTADQYLAAAQHAAAVWSHDEVACSDLRLTVVADPAADAITGNDHQNMIVFRQDTWCPRGDAAVGCYPANALAITTVWKNKQTGEIPDADIEINAVTTTAGTGFQWADIASQPGAGIDFQNMLTHELGHVLGFSHNCYTPSDSVPSLVDHTGAATLSCYGGTLPAEVAEATMFPSVDRSDISRRTLSPDDQQAVCDVYPYTHDACPIPAPPSTGGCSLAPASPVAGHGVAPWLVLVGIGWLGRRKNKGLTR